MLLINNKCVGLKKKNPHHLNNVNDRTNFMTTELTNETNDDTVNTLSTLCSLTSLMVGLTLSTWCRCQHLHLYHLYH